MNSHAFDPTLRRCLGCDASARDIEDDGRYADCHAFYRRIGNDTTIIINTHEQLIVLTGDSVMTLTQSTMFELRDAICDGVRELRAGKRSKVAPA